MESTLTNPPKEKIYPSDLKLILENYTGTIKVLSLDCFDTILWRSTATPIDVFFRLQHKPMFQNLGFSAQLRMRAESHARSLKGIKEKKTEVRLHDIYHAAFPTLSPSELDRLVEEELTTEMEVCYAHPAIVDFMRAAHERKIKIIIVSDTYFNEVQLRKLLTHCLPKDVMSSIEMVFCSCEHEKSKVNGLFNVVLQNIAHPAKTILHIGDNVQADVNAANKSNIHALHFIHHDKGISDQLRLHSIAASIFNPTIRHSDPLTYPFRGLLANTKIDKPEQMIGYASIGPIMYAFAKFILHEIDKLRKMGKTPKVLFLMRDANLPYMVCEEITGKSVGHRVRISRFAAYAATFRSKADICDYLATVMGTGRFREIAKQLLLPEEIIEPLLQVLSQSASPIGEFLNLIHGEDIQSIILKKSTLFRQRLIHYLKKEINLKQGDTLLFVDLGYSGTAQRLLEPVLKEELNIEILGRYLIELNIPNWHKSRAGLLDPSWCDDRLMASLVAHIALLEQISTSNEKSVIDYDNHGNPIFSDSVFEKTQYTKLEKIQNECLRFAKDAEIFFKKTKELPMQTLRETAMAELARFIYLPTESEINYLESFEFDVNLGTKDVLRVFDTTAGLNSLKKRGLHFSFMEKNNKSMRTNYPAELRFAGLELVMSLMTQYRFSLDLGYKDMSLRREKVAISATNGIEQTSSVSEAILTYDGYFSLSLPIGRTFDLIIKFGQQYQWLEIENAELINMSLYLSNADSLLAEDYLPNITFNEILNRGGKLFECQSTSSSITIPRLIKNSNENYLIRLVFRPIVFRNVDKQNS